MFISLQWKIKYYTHFIIHIVIFTVMHGNLAIKNELLMMGEQRVIQVGETVFCWGKIWELAREKNAIYQWLTVNYCKDRVYLAWKYSYVI